MAVNWRVLSESVVEYRTALGLNQKELAKKANVSPVFISQIEASDRKCSMETLEKLSVAFGFPPELLYVLTQDKPKTKVESVLKFHEKMMKTAKQIANDLLYKQGAARQQ